MVFSGIFFFFFNDTATTEIYTLSLHDALPISIGSWPSITAPRSPRAGSKRSARAPRFWRLISAGGRRSEEHTSELQSPCNLVCRLLLEKKKKFRAALVSLLHRVLWFVTSLDSA